MPSLAVDVPHPTPTTHPHPSHLPSPLLGRQVGWRGTAAGRRPPPCSVGCCRPAAPGLRQVAGMKKGTAQSWSSRRVRWQVRQAGWLALQQCSQLSTAARPAAAVGRTTQPCRDTQAAEHSQAVQLCNEVGSMHAQLHTALRLPPAPPWPSRLNSSITADTSSLRLPLRRRHTQLVAADTTSYLSSSSSAEGKPDQAASRVWTVSSSLAGCGGTLMSTTCRAGAQV